MNSVAIDFDDRIEKIFFWNTLVTKSSGVFNFGQTLSKIENVKIFSVRIVKATKMLKGLNFVYDQLYDMSVPI